MKHKIGVLACAALVMTSGCSVIRDELRYPGGAPGRLLDKRTFDASESKQLQILRASLALAIAARIGEGSVATEDADAFARQLAEAANELNYAAVDAGFPVKKSANSYHEACSIGIGKDRPNPTPTPTPTPTPNPIPSPTPASTSGPDYRELDANCVGFYVNFEAHISKIESRIVRAMLTSLPTDKAREFIDDLVKGDLLSALWSLTESLNDLAGAFRRGAGVYRAGIENLAASTKKCDWDPSSRWKDGDLYDERYDTVLKAAACLGLSSRDLFDSEDISASKLPNRINPIALIALFRIARTSCVNLPLLNAVERETTNKDDWRDKNFKARDAACDHLYFDPMERQTDLDKDYLKGDKVETPDESQPVQPAQPAPPPPPAPSEPESETSRPPLLLPDVPRR